MTWRPTPRTLSPHALHLWRVPLTTALPTHYNALNAQERARAARYRAVHARDAFVCARATLRRTLARWLDLEDPRDVPLTTREREKPCLLGSDLEFNVSHSHDWALIGVTRGHPLGVDVDFEGRSTDYERLALRVFSEREKATWANLASEERRRPFYSGWTRKEAYLKALGMGLTIELGHVSVSMGSEAALEEATHPRAEPDVWEMRAFDVAPGYPGAVATRAPMGEVGLWEVDETFGWVTSDE